MDIIKTGAFLLLGLATGALIPTVSCQMIQYKCKKRGKAIPEFTLQQSYKLLLAIINAGAFAFAGWLMPLPEACLVSVFAFIALVSVIVDIHIRIICNEAVLLIFVMGIAYRIFNGGFSSLLGSLAALGIVLVVFGSAAFLTKKLTSELGVGAGDIKLAMAIAITVGVMGVFYFLGGVAVAIGAYSVLGLMYHFLTKKSTFPMCGHIMFGFFAALFVPYFLQ